MMQESTTHLNADYPYTVSFIPLNNVTRNRRVVNLEQPMSIGRLLDKDDPGPTSLKFASKVVSRQHAMIGFCDGRLWIQDTKSSSGTFVNGQRLSLQGQESRKVEINEGGVIRLGEDCEVNGVVHQSVILKVVFGAVGMRERLGSQDSGIVEVARLETDSGNDHYIDFSLDPQVRANVDAEFNFIWSSLTQGLDHPLQRLRDISQNHQPQWAPSTSADHTLLLPPPENRHQKRPSISRLETAVPGRNDAGVGKPKRPPTLSVSSASSAGTTASTSTVLNGGAGLAAMPSTPLTAVPFFSH
ncbi:hypothetical protein SpCBS45565_g02439 [Spizellomyces sp. 'palustris']|nr:hypothetical protein SpCBS45565_g02439 [Spizellomyces sp. 'palustris']